jgi:parallel beta-helix repeat protein
MMGYWKHDWADAYCRVKSIDLVSNVVSFAGSKPFGVGGGTWGLKGRRFYAVNVLSELDAPGEWFLDRKAKKLFYMPDPAKDGEELVLASFDDSLVKLLDGVRHVRFENLDFEYSHAPGNPALDMVKCADVEVRGCNFSNLAGPAVRIRGERCSVVDCRIWNTGGTAVSIDGGNRSALLPSQNLLARTDIGFYGTFKRTFAPAVHLHGCGSAIRSCRFHDGPYIALWYYGNEHLIADNVFERVVLEAGDSAAIYSGRDASSWGNVVFGNVIRELGAGSEMAAYRMGVYLDDCDCGDAIIGNEFSGSGYGVFIGGGNGNIVANNFVTNCLKALHLDSRGDTWNLYTAAHDGNSWWHSMLKPFDYRAYPWVVFYPAAPKMVDDHPNLPWMNTFDGNTAVDCKIDYDFNKTALSVTNRMTLVKTPRAQPVRLSDAKTLRLESPGGHLVAEFALDNAGRLSWRLERDGAPVVLSSPLGFTADGRDYGRLVVPGGAVRADGPDFAGATIPLADLVTGAVVAHFEARVYFDRVSWRWRIPGTGRRRVNGDGSAWRLAKGVEVGISEKGSAPGFQKAWRAARAADAYSLVYALSPSGFDVDGEIVTPWRETAVDSCGEPKKVEGKASGGFRIMSYNVRHCEGMDKVLDVPRVAAVVNRSRPRFAALQEIDCRTKRSRGIDEAKELGRLTGMVPTFAKTIDFDGGEYGVMILSREKPISVEKIPLPGKEPRVLLLAEFTDCFVGSTHLSVSAEKERADSVALIEKAVKGRAKPVFVAGDWNSLPDSSVLKDLGGFLKVLSRTDCRTYHGSPANGPSGTAEDFCIDYIAVDSSRAAKFKVIERSLIADRVTSDHAPIQVTVVPIP